MAIQKHRIRGILVAGALLALATACGGGDGDGGDAGHGDGGPADGGGSDGTVEDGGGSDGGEADGAGADAGSDGDAGPGVVLDESEPNDGTTVDEVNDLPVGVPMRGVVGSADDVDIFSVPTTGARAYRARLTTADGSPLEGHLTVIDSGRDSEPAGDDFAHLSRTGTSGVEVEWLAMGDGHLVAVRDARAVGGTGMGGDDYGYELVVEELDLSSVATALDLPSTTTGSLAHAGAMNVARFTGVEWTDVVFDLTATHDSMNARLFIVAESTGDWIARNDDRAAGDVDPLIDAPLTAGGTLYLVIDNIEETATSLGYTLEASLP